MPKRKMVLDYTGEVELPIWRGELGDLKLLHLETGLGEYVSSYLPDIIYNKYRYLDGEKARRGRLHILVELIEEGE